MNFHIFNHISQLVSRKPPRPGDWWSTSQQSSRSPRRTWWSDCPGDSVWTLGTMINYRKSRHPSEIICHENYFSLKNICVLPGPGWRQSSPALEECLWPQYLHWLCRCREHDPSARTNTSSTWSSSVSSSGILTLDYPRCWRTTSVSEARTWPRSWRCLSAWIVIAGRCHHRKLKQYLHIIICSTLIDDSEHQTKPRLFLCLLKLTFLQRIVTWVTHSARLPLSVSERSLVAGAGGAHHAPARSAVVSPVHQGELGGAGLTHGDPGVWYPDRSSVSQLVVRSEGTVHVQRDKGGLPAPVVLNSTVESIQPIIPLLNTPARENIS